MIKLSNILEQVLLEYEIFDYKKKDDQRYEFEVPIDKETLDRLKAQGVNISTPKLRYFVTVNHDMRKHRFGQYEAEFGVQGQRSAGETINLGVKHLMSVIYTSLEIVDKMVEELKIANLKIDGAAGEKDTTGAWGGMEPTQRSNIYDRIIRKHYPSSAVKTTGRFIEIDMKKAKPEIFKGQDNKVEVLIDAVMKYLNTGEGAYPREDIERGISGTSVTNFELSTDAIIHPKYGAMYFDAQVSDYDGTAGDFYEASVEWMDKVPPGSDGSDFKDFANFQQLLNWVKSLA
jgi:post-segregation antitoxin (ccd killing protein)